MMNSVILYSFIVPHKNNPNLLNRCIDSIPKRNDIQIIVVDDNSSPDNKPIIEREDTQIVLLNGNESKGAGHARNVGLKHAIGKWILFADCDDLYKDGFVDILDIYVNDEIDVLFYNCIYAESQTLKELPPIKISKVISEYDESEVKIQSLKYLNNAPWSKMVRRSFIEKFGFYFEEIPNGNDYLFSLFIGYYCKRFEVCKETIYIYTKNNIGLSNKKKMSKEEHFYRLAYFFKKKAFLNSMNMREDKESSLVIYLLHMLKSKGLEEFLRSLLILIKNIKNLYCQKDYYINSVRQFESI